MVRMSRVLSFIFLSMIVRAETLDEKIRGAVAGFSGTVGVFLGGLSGYLAGMTDTVIQRLIEILRSIPTIPLWMGLAAAVPKDWDIIRVFFVMTIIFSLFSWTELARVVRGRFLSLRDEDFVTACARDLTAVDLAPDRVPGARFPSVDFDRRRPLRHKLLHERFESIER